MLLPVVERQLDAEVAGQGDEVDRRVGRSAERGVDRDGVEEALARHHVRRLEILGDHFDDALAGQIGRFLPVAMRCRDRRGSRQHHAERLGQRVHRRRGAHGVAVAGRGRRAGDQPDESLVVDLALGEQFARLPHDRARAGPLALVPAVEHRPDRQRDRRDVHRRRGHQAGRRGLVAPGGQHHAVERVAVDQFDQRDIGEVAVERGGRALAGFLDRVDGEFERDPARLADAFADPLGEDEVVPVARAQVAAGLGDADDRLAAAQFGEAQAEIEIALEIERGHVDVVGIVEPRAASQLLHHSSSCARLTLPMGSNSPTNRECASGRSLAGIAGEGGYGSGAGWKCRRGFGRRRQGDELPAGAGLARLAVLHVGLHHRHQQHAAAAPAQRVRAQLHPDHASSNPSGSSPTA